MTDKFRCDPVESDHSGCDHRDAWTKINTQPFPNDVQLHRSGAEGGCVSLAISVM